MISVAFSICLPLEQHAVRACESTPVDVTDVRAAKDISRGTFAAEKKPSSLRIYIEHVICLQQDLSLYNRTDKQAPPPIT